MTGFVAPAEVVALAPGAVVALFMPAKNRPIVACRLPFALGAGARGLDGSWRSGVGGWAARSFFSSSVGSTWATHS